METVFSSNKADRPQKRQQQQLHHCFTFIPKKGFIYGFFSSFVLDHLQPLGPLGIKKTLLRKFISCLVFLQHKKINLLFGHFFQLVFFFCSTFPVRKDRWSVRKQGGFPVRFGAGLFANTFTDL